MRTTKWAIGVKVTVTPKFTSAEPTPRVFTRVTFYLVAASILLSSNIAIGTILYVFVIFGPVFKLYIADICAPDAWMAGSSTAHTNYLTTRTSSSTREHAFFLYKLVATNLRAPFHVSVSLYIDILIKL